MKKRLIGYAAALLAVSMLAGCGAPAAGTGAFFVLRAVEGRMFRLPSVPEQ